MRLILFLLTVVSLNTVALPLAEPLVIDASEFNTCYSKDWQTNVAFANTLRSLLLSSKAISLSPPRSLLASEANDNFFHIPVSLGKCQKSGNKTNCIIGNIDYKPTYGQLPSNVTYVPVTLDEFVAQSGTTASNMNKFIDAMRWAMKKVTGYDKYICSLANQYSNQKDYCKGDALRSYVSIPGLFDIKGNGKIVYSETTVNFMLPLSLVEPIPSPRTCGITTLNQCDFPYPIGNKLDNIQVSKTTCPSTATGIVGGSEHKLRFSFAVPTEIIFRVTANSSTVGKLFKVKDGIETLIQPLTGDVILYNDFRFPTGDYMLSISHSGNNSYFLTASVHPINCNYRYNMPMPRWDINNIITNLCPVKYTFKPTVNIDNVQFMVTPMLTNAMPQDVVLKMEVYQSPDNGTTLGNLFATNTGSVATGGSAKIITNVTANTQYVILNTDTNPDHNNIGNMFTITGSDTSVTTSASWVPRVAGQPSYVDYVEILATPPSAIIDQSYWDDYEEMNIIKANIWQFNHATGSYSSSFKQIYPYVLMNEYNWNNNSNLTFILHGSDTYAPVFFNLRK